MNAEICKLTSIADVGAVPLLSSCSTIAVLANISVPKVVRARFHYIP